MNVLKNNGLTKDIKKDFSKHVNNITELILNKETNPLYNISSLTGRMSKSIFLSYLGLYNESNKKLYSEISEKNISEILEQINNERVSLTMIDGLAGFGWGISHLCNNDLLQEEQEVLLNELDQLLFEQSLIDLKDNRYDYFYGAIGYGLYFLERSQSNKSIINFISKLINQLETIRKEYSGIKIWQTNEDKEANSFDFSLSHGLSSFIIFLTKAIQLNIQPKICDEFLEDIYKAIHLTKENTLNGTQFPDCIEDNKAIFSSLRWCHGHLGITYALAYSGKMLQNKEYINLAKEGVPHILQNKITDFNELYSPTLCHGTLGVAHIINKLFDLLGDDKLKATANYWYEQSNCRQSSACSADVVRTCVRMYLCGARRRRQRLLTAQLDRARL